MSNHECNNQGHGGGSSAAKNPSHILKGAEGKSRGDLHKDHTQPQVKNRRGANKPMNRGGTVGAPPM